MQIRTDRLNLLGWGMMLMLALVTGMLIRTLMTKYISDPLASIVENDSINYSDDNGLVEVVEVQIFEPVSLNEEGATLTHSYLSPQDGPWIQIQNNIEVTVSNLRREGSNLKVDVCFDMPDKSDWMLEPTSSVDYSGIKGVGGGFNNFLYERATETQSGYRCDTVHFGIPDIANFANITLTLYIAAPPREGKECDFYQNQAQKLKAQGLDIQFSCNIISGGTDVTIDKKPAGMTEEEAGQLIFGPEAMVLPTPWVFSFSQ